MRRWMRCVLTIVIALTGCHAAFGRAEMTAPLLPAVHAADTTVLAEGRVEPARWVTLHAAVPAQVSEVHVGEGDRVVEGDVLAVFDIADLVLLVQQMEAALNVAVAQVAIICAGARPETLAVMDAQVAAATAVVSQSMALLEAQSVGETQAAVAAAKADILSAQVIYDAADDGHDDTMKCYSVTQEDGSRREICPALGTFEEMARAQMEAAGARLEAAQAELDAVKRVSGTETQVARVDVGVAQANMALAQASRERAAAGSHAEQVRVAEAAVDEAEAALAGVLAKLGAMAVKAPFDGVVSHVDVLPGETVGVGAPLVTIATLDDLQVRTRDLTELDVVRTSNGQPAAIRADAYPDVTLAGHVENIEPQSTDYLGDVTYAAILTLSETPAWLRWGMTVKVEVGDTVWIEPVPVAAPLDDEPGGGPVAEAVVVPVLEAALGPQIGGRVAAINVGVGQWVAEGDVILALDTDGLEAGVQQAEAAFATADANLALAMAPPLPEDVVMAQAEIDLAQAELARAVAQRDHLSAQLGGAQTAAVEAELATAKAHRREVEAYLQWAEGDEDDARIEAWRLKLAAADQEIVAIELRLAAQPQARWAQLRAAEAGVHAAEGKVAVAEAKLALIAAGPTAESAAVAVAQAQQAQPALDAARLQLARAEVRAPFDGTVAEVDVEVGDAVMAGQVLVMLATLDRFEVRTKNLMEVDVVNVTPGQRVTVKLDALPGQILAGTVMRVGLQEELYRGDVTYPVVIALDEQPKALRWGMSAVVEIGH